MSVARRVRRKNMRCFRSASKKKRAERGAVFLKRLGGTQSAQGRVTPPERLLPRDCYATASTTTILSQPTRQGDISIASPKGTFLLPLDNFHNFLDDSDVAKYTQTALRRHKLPHPAWAFEREGERCLQSNSFKPVQLC